MPVAVVALALGPAAVAVATVTRDGIGQTWPTGALGDPDNAMANGQTIDVPSATSSDTKLALLGSASNDSTSRTLTNTYLFATAPTALKAGKQVKSITLPSTTSGGGAVHMFSVGVA